MHRKAMFDSTTCLVLHTPQAAMNTSFCPQTRIRQRTCSEKDSGQFLTEFIAKRLQMRFTAKANGPVAFNLKAKCSWERHRRGQAFQSQSAIRSLVLMCLLRRESQLLTPPGLLVHLSHHQWLSWCQALRFVFSCREIIITVALLFILQLRNNATTHQRS